MLHRPSYANVAASLALFIALGGTAAAAVTLPRDSVGSPEIQKDAVRSPEIRRDAVRSSEIRDHGALLTDISNSAQDALRSNVRVAEKDFVSLPVCTGSDLRDCPNLLERSLGSPAADAARNWLVEAKLVLSTPDGSARALENRCGLVQAVNQPPAVIDEVRVGRLPDSSSTEVIALSGVITERDRNSAIALRCTMQQFEEIEVEDMKITAVQMGTVTGP